MSLENELQLPFEDIYFCWLPKRTNQGTWHWLSTVKQTTWFSSESNMTGTIICPWYVYDDLTYEEQEKYD